MVWDGHTADGRVVGSGTYLAIVYLKALGSGDNEIKRVRIAIQR